MSGGVERAREEQEGPRRRRPMHGVVMKGLKDYVVTEYGRTTWRAVRDCADVERRLYAPVARYPDSHWSELAAATRAVTGVDRTSLHFEVGRYLAPTLLQVYGGHVDGVDSGLDMLADAGPTVSEALRRKGCRDVAPPEVTGERLAADRVLVRYRGDWCTGLRGVVAGLGERYGEAYDITERACVGNGDARCELLVRRPEARAGPEAATSDD